ncbi:hypothetical protein EON82_07560 [bacterium]|nr:MAG: hypothetical protein EON82_07560 [bacterium]
MNRLLVSFAGLLAVSLAHADGSELGRYRLRVPSDAARVARLAGKEEPYGRLDLREGGRFTLITETAYRRGRYVVDGDRLILIPEKGEELRGDLRDGHVSLEGLDFDYTDRQPFTVERRFPTDASSGRLDRREAELRRDRDRREDRSERTRPIEPQIEEALPPVVTPPVTIPPVAIPPVERAPARAKVDLPKLESSEVVGVWTVRRDGYEEKGQRMELKKDGSFRFAMAGATSEGRWRTEGRTIVLVWTRIDGEKVEDDSVRKEIPVADDASAFQIDTFRYERASR